MKTTVTFIIVLLASWPIRAGLISSQPPVNGGGVSRWSKLWVDPSPAGNNLDGDAICYEDFVLARSATINHMEWWGTGASELGFQIEFWKQDPGTVAYQPYGVFRESGALPKDAFTTTGYTAANDTGGLTHFSLDLSSAVTLAANDATNPRWFVAIIGLTSAPYAEWNWAQNAFGSNRTFQFIRGGSPAGGDWYTALSDGRAMVLSGTVSGSPIHSSWASAVIGNWSDASKWTTAVPNIVGDGAVFNIPAMSAVTVTLDMPVTLGSLQFGNSGNANTGYAIVGSITDTLTLDNSGNGATISSTDGTHSINAPVVLADTLTVGGRGIIAFGTASSISGGKSLTMSGTGGKLILSGSNIYTGGTSVTAGTLDVTNPVALPDGSSVIIGANAALVFGTAPSATAVPEPSTIALLAFGAAGAVGWRWRRQKRTAQPANDEAYLEARSC